MRQPSSHAASGKVTPCCSKVGLKRGPWTAEEDEVLGNYIRKEGEGRWRTLPKRAGLLRCGKSCRLRWMNYLRPNVKRGHIAPDEEDLILRLHRLLGNRWSLIAGRIPGRTDNEIKNYWNTHLSKKLINQGIDPRTHKPLITTTPSPTSTGQDKPRSSSSKPNYRARNPNLVVTSTLEDDDQVLNNGNHDGYNYHGSHVNLQNNSGNEEQDDDEINYSTDDVFMSSFLNSLINEDVFSAQNHHLHHLSSNIGITAPAPAPAAASSDSFMSHPSSFAFGAGWENPIMSSGYNGFNQYEPKKLSTHDPATLG